MASRHSRGRCRHDFGLDIGRTRVSDHLCRIADRDTADAIVRGAGLYAQNLRCVPRAQAGGDGPAATSLSIMPTDLAAHALKPRAGAERSGGSRTVSRGTPMPGFCAATERCENWDLVQFLRAQSAAMTSRGLAAVVAPHFTFELAGQGQQSRGATAREPITLLVCTCCRRRATARPRRANKCLRRDRPACRCHPVVRDCQRDQCGIRR